MNSESILVVDDDRNLLEVIRMRLESAKYAVATAWDEDVALTMAKGQVFDLAVIDLQLVHTDGITLMQQLHMINPDMPVVILTAYGTIESAVSAMKKGAFSYLAKPFDAQELLFQIDRALEKRSLTTEIKRLKGLLQEKYDFNNIVAKSEIMQDVLKQVLRIAKTDSTVYIQGESGTGKELIAKAIHLLSDRKDRPFVDLNCAALPETLLESELFGYESGAFTGAIRSKEGLFTRAHRGTIFLDEIGDMPLSIQAKLLRVLQERRFYPVGGKRSVEVDLRVIVATNKDLVDEIKEGRFREDLYYRIHVIPIHLPALRERKDDIPSLVRHFISDFSRRMNKDIKTITPQAMQMLMLYDWPSNVRQLRNTLEYAVAMAQQNVISEDLLHIQKDTTSPPMPLKEAKADFEKSYIIKLLQLTQGNVSRAADLAGKYRADFYDLLKKYRLKAKDYKSN
ncbi:MAG TPA: sigma-54 dependent transcriptional regulator [Thermodesulfobacteriota bacterium]|nr:sigma-54 dependent transcriptional regulator [Thermodesulfobacteriota bacterium]